MARNDNCTHLGQLSAQPLDRPQLQSGGKIKVSGRQFTHFQRKTDNCDLEPFLKVVLLRILQGSCILLKRPNKSDFGGGGGILIEQQMIVT